MPDHQLSISRFYQAFPATHRSATLDILTYLPHEAVAEVSKDKEPIGRECAEFNWFESQLMSDSSEVRFK